MPAPIRYRGYTPTRKPTAKPSSQPNWLQNVSSTLRNALEAIGGYTPTGSTLPAPSPVQYQQAARNATVRYRGPQARSTGSDLQAYAAQQRAQLLRNQANPQQAFTYLPNQNLNDLQRYAAYTRSQLVQGQQNIAGGQYTPARQVNPNMKDFIPQYPGVRRTTTRNYVETPAYMRPGYVPGVNTAAQMPEKTYRKIFQQPTTVAMQAYPQGYAEMPYPETYAGAGAGAGGYGGYGYGGGGGYSYPDQSYYTGPNEYSRNRGQLPYMPNLPRWLQGLVTWRFS